VAAVIAEEATKTADRKIALQDHHAPKEKTKKAVPPEMKEGLVWSDPNKVHDPNVKTVSNAQNKAHREKEMLRVVIVLQKN
jgi:hypothetical protein